MDIILQIVLLVAGFVLLIKGADIFVGGASKMAEIFHVPKMLIGLTIVAFGTSAPELAVSISALVSGSTDMVIGNVIGSCILNILLILGLTATIYPIEINDDTVKKELPLTMLISMVLAVLFLDVVLAGGATNEITREDGIIILLFFLIFLYYLVVMAKRGDGKSSAAEKVATEKIDQKKVAAKGASVKNRKKKAGAKKGLWKQAVFIVLGLAGLVLGSQIVVDNASAIAMTLGMSERLIGMTIVALGTSLPELVTSVTAARKHESALAVGNIIGSNIFNICIVLGVPVVMFGTVTQGSFSLIDLAMLVGSSVLLFFFAKSRCKISRVEGGLMLVVFAVYYGFILLA